MDAKRASMVLVAVLAAAPALALGSGPRRTQRIDTVVIHSTGGPTCDAATGRPVWIDAGTLADDVRGIEAHPRLGVHYLIGRDGTVHASVPEDRVAYHVFRIAGRSIGIELVNEGDGRDPFPLAQLDALVALLRDIVRRHPVARSGIVRHSDVDHGRMACDRTRPRKVDPGDAFPFEAVVQRVFAPP